MVRHETAVTRPNYSIPLNTDLLQQLPDGNRLKNLGPEGGSGGGVAEEDEVRHVEIEVGREVLDLTAPLPNADGAEPVNEEEYGLMGGCGWAPEVDSSLLIYINGL